MNLRLKTEFHGVRGEMPGSSALATKNNNKGPFKLDM